MATGNVAVLIDFENISSAKDVETVLDISSQRGEVVAKKAFGDWTGPIESGQKYLNTLGVDMVNQETLGKGGNSCDMRLVIDAMDLLHDATRTIDVFVLVTSDVDFVPLVVRLKSAGKAVVGAGRPEVTSDRFRAAVDEFIPIGNSPSAITKSTHQHPEKLMESHDPTKGLSSVGLPNAYDTGSNRNASRSLDADTKSLILNAASEVSEKNNGIIKGAALHGSMKMIMPGFDYRDLGFDNFTDMLSLHDGLIVKGKGSPGDITVTVKSS